MFAGLEIVLSKVGIPLSNGFYLEGRIVYLVQMLAVWVPVLWMGNRSW